MKKSKTETKELVHVSLSRSEDQKKVMEKIAEEAHCPFCAENLSKYHKNPILKEGKFWLITKNQWPYDNTKNHFLAISKKHIEHIREMEIGSAEELFSLFKNVSKEMPGGALVIRFGSNPEKGNYGGSVLHLHAHLIEPDLENPKKEAVKIKIGQPKID